ncbi:gamma-glutamyltransferase [Chitinophagales bacterium]|nr:gamma-glutamyltransferase [Chitinophagales bacterium]
MKKIIGGTISAGNRQTAQAAEQAFLEGGNAFDAAIAALLAACVCEPSAVSLGGGVFMLGQKKRIPFLIDGFCQSPLSKEAVKLERLDFNQFPVDFGAAQEDFYIGKAAMAVPGVPAAIMKLWKTRASLPLEILAEPAIDLAKNGFELSGFGAMYMDFLSSVNEASEYGRLIYRKEGKGLQEGDRIFNGHLADTLEELCSNKMREFYEGEIAARVEEACAYGQGFLQRADFEKYASEELEPTTVPIGDKQLLLGNTIGSRMLEYGILKQNEDSRNDSDDLLKVFQAMMEEREKAMDKSSHGNWAGTTHFSVADNEGNGMAVTGSNGEGSGFIIPGSGIMMNNVLGEPALVPNGPHSWDLNKRLSSMMTPALLTNEEGELTCLLGSGGSSRIPFAVLQVLNSYLKGATLEQAMTESRVHWENGTLYHEPDFRMPKNRFWEQESAFDEQSFFFGGVHAVQRYKDSWLGVADHRREGSSITVSRRA